MYLCSGPQTLSASGGRAEPFLAVNITHSWQSSYMHRANGVCQLQPAKAMMPVFSSPCEVKCCNYVCEG